MLFLLGSRRRGGRLFQRAGRAKLPVQIFGGSALQGQADAVLVEGAVALVASVALQVQIHVEYFALKSSQIS